VDASEFLRLATLHYHELAPASSFDTAAFLDAQRAVGLSSEYDAAVHRAEREVTSAHSFSISWSLSASHKSDQTQLQARLSQLHTAERDARDALAAHRASERQFGDVYHGVFSALVGHGLVPVRVDSFVSVLSISLAMSLTG
jgi:hypothetical protein